MSYDGTCQRKAYRQFTVEDGLASDVVYDVASDEDGFLWFTTNSGVSKFDGYSFTNFSQKDGLADVENFEFIKDNRKRLWLIGHSNRLSIIEDQKLRPYEFNDTILSEVGGRTLPGDLHITDSGEVLFSTSNRGAIRIDEQGNAKYIEQENGSEYYHMLFDFGAENLFRVYPVTPRKNGNEFPLIIVTGDTMVVTAKYSRRGRSSLRVSDNGWLLHKDLCSIFLIDSAGEKEIYKGVDEILFIKRMDEKIWIGTRNGVFQTKDHISLSRGDITHLLPDIIVTGVEQDINGNYWISSLFNGVFFFPRSSFYHITNDEIQDLVSVTSVFYDSRGVLYLGCKNGTIHFSDDMKSFERLNYSPVQKQINKFCELNNRIYFVCFGDRIYSFSTDKIVSSIHDRMMFRNMDLRGDSILLCGTLRLLLLKDNKIRELAADSDLDNIRVLNAILGTVGDVILNTGNRLISYKSESRESVDLDLGLLPDPVRIGPISALDSGIIAVGTVGHGILVYGGSVSFLIDESSGLIGNTINCLFVSGDKLFVGTQKGLSIVSFTQDHSTDYEIVNFDTEDGLLDNSIQSIYFSDSLLFLGGRNGATILKYPFESIVDTFPEVFLESVVVGEDSLDMDEQLSYFGSLGNFDFRFTGLYYKSFGNIQYKYRLQGFEEDWSLTRNRLIRYTSLPPGNYEFQVSAKNHSGLWSKKPTVFRFAILPPFWQTWWFYSFEIVVSVLVIFLLINWRIRYLNQVAMREKMSEQERAKLELQALRYQMNPHFLFNTLNSIQSFISSRKPDDAVRYLARFSKLIRRNLEQSKDSSISLTEEVDSLRIYLDLEKMRFDDKFDYLIDNRSPKVSSSVMIPSMLVQPFVENAVLHGVQKLDSPGFITVVFEVKGKSVKCVIEDNGVGRDLEGMREKAGEKRHKSVGMTITKKRLALLNKKILEPEVKIVDLHKDGTPCGTRIELDIDIIGNKT